MTSEATSLKPAASYIQFDIDGRPHLQGSRCGECDAVFVGQRENCGRCGARSRMRLIQLGAHGRLYSFTIVNRSYPGIKVPFISAVVDLDGGGTVKGNLLDIAAVPEQLQFDMRVRVVFRGAESASAEGAGYIAHFFIPDTESSGG